MPIVINSSARENNVYVEANEVKSVYGRAYLENYIADYTNKHYLSRIKKKQTTSNAVNDEVKSPVIMQTTSSVSEDSISEAESKSQEKSGRNSKKVSGMEERLSEELKKDDEKYLAACVWHVSETGVPETTMKYYLALDERYLTARMDLSLVEADTDNLLQGLSELTVPSGTKLRLILTGGESKVFLRDEANEKVYEVIVGSDGTINGEPAEECFDGITADNAAV